MRPSTLVLFLSRRPLGDPGVGRTRALHGRRSSRPPSRLPIAEKRKDLFSLDVILKVDHIASAIQDFRHLLEINDPDTGTVGIMQARPYDDASFLYCYSGEVPNLGIQWECSFGQFKACLDL